MMDGLGSFRVFYQRVTALPLVVCLLVKLHFNFYTLVYRLNHVVLISLLLGARADRTRGSVEDDKTYRRLSVQKDATSVSYSPNTITLKCTFSDSFDSECQVSYCFAKILQAQHP
jgi:hypothetical protein